MSTNQVKKDLSLAIYQKVAQGEKMVIRDMNLPKCPPDEKLVLDMVSCVLERKKKLLGEFAVRLVGVVVVVFRPGLCDSSPHDFFLVRLM